MDARIKTSGEDDLETARVMHNLGKVLLHPDNWRYAHPVGLLKRVVAVSWQVARVHAATAGAAAVPLWLRGVCII